VCVVASRGSKLDLVNKRYCGVAPSDGFAPHRGLTVHVPATVGQHGSLQPAAAHASAHGHGAGGEGARSEAVAVAAVGAASVAAVAAAKCAKSRADMATIIVVRDGTIIMGPLPMQEWSVGGSKEAPQMVQYG
jgi:hypothetical protein